MIWNWEQQEWPNFRYDIAQAAQHERRFLVRSGEGFGASLHLSEKDRLQLEIGILSAEAMETSELEGEILNRDSVQSSIQKQLGLKGDGRRVLPSEQGIAELMVNVYQGFEDVLTDEMLRGWHEMVTRGRTDLDAIGRYRTHPEPMRIVSGPIHQPKVHFEAPPSDRVPEEMVRFLRWFNATRDDLPATVRAALAHLHFESIHPFEDGNGRVGRAIAEFSISQSLGKPVLLSLSQAISKRKKLYYQELSRASRTLEVSSWVGYFSETIIEAQEATARMVNFILGKTKLLDRLQGQLNARQEKSLLRMFREGVDGFKGGLSSANYQAITGASAATATRDLTDLVAKGALRKTGSQRTTRYWLTPH